MTRLEYEKYKLDQLMKLATVIALLIFAGVLCAVHSSLASTVVSLVIGLVGGHAVAGK